MKRIVLVTWNKRKIAPTSSGGEGNTEKTPVKLLLTSKQFPKQESRSIKGKKEGRGKRIVTTTKIKS